MLEEEIVLPPLSFYSVPEGKMLRRLCPLRCKADIFISGHVHINVLEKRGNTVFLNPGSPSLSKREDNRATVAVLEDKTIKIIDIDTDEVIMTLTL